MNNFFAAAFSPHDQVCTVAGFVVSLVSTLFIVRLVVLTPTVQKYQIPLPFDPAMQRWNSQNLKRNTSWYVKYLQDRALQKGYRLCLINPSKALELYCIISVIVFVLYTVQSHELFVLRAAVMRVYGFVDSVVLRKLYTKGVSTNNGISWTLFPTLAFSMGANLMYFSDKQHHGAYLDAASAVSATIVSASLGTTLWLDNAYDKHFVKTPSGLTTCQALRFAKFGSCVRVVAGILDAVGAYAVLVRLASLGVNAVANAIFVTSEQLAETAASNFRSYTLLPLFTLQEASRLQILDGSGAVTDSVFPEGYTTQIRRQALAHNATFQARQRQRTHTD